MLRPHDGAFVATFTFPTLLPSSPGRQQLSAAMRETAFLSLSSFACRSRGIHQPFLMPRTASPSMASRRPGSKSLPFFDNIRTNHHPTSPPREDAVPGNAASGNGALGNAVPGNAGPGNAVPGNATPSNAVPGNETSVANLAPTPITAAADRVDEMQPVSAPPRARTMDVKIFGMHLRIPGRLLLLSVPFLWSSYSICLKWLYRLPWAFSPAVFNFVRLTLAALVVLPALLSGLRETRRKYGSETTKTLILASCELGFYTISVNIMQAYGLRFTSASRGAFLGQLSTIIVPLSAFAVGLEPSLGWNVCIASVVAVFGVGLLTLDNVSAAFSVRGDGMMIATAVATAVYILRTKMHGDKVGKGPVAEMKICSQAVLAMIYFAVSSGWLTGGQTASMATVFAGATPALIAINMGIVLWAGVFVSVLSTILQIRGQRLVSASEAVIIFTSAPLWAAAMAIPLGERFGVRGVIGAALILMSTFLSSQESDVGKKGKKSEA